MDIYYIPINSIIGKVVGPEYKPYPGYHPVELTTIPAEQRAAYMGVAQRNALGYTLMPALGLTTIIGICILL